MSPPPPFASAFVLGSGSAVAEAIVRDLARRGCRRFHLVARRPQANAALIEELRRQGALVSSTCTDLLADASLEQPAVPELNGDFDLYLITAGSLGDAQRARGDAAEALRITAANYSGLLPWITAIATPERLRRPGSLWIFGSVAAERGRPSNYHYGAAKAALTTLAEGLRLRCQGGPFAVRLIQAGFMATPMTEGKAPPALCISPQAVARILLRRPHRRGREFLPWIWGPVMALVRRLPPAVAQRL